MSDRRKKLAGKTAWITGSSRGIGRKIAEHFASLGADVSIHGTSPTSTQKFDGPESLEELASQIAENNDSNTLAVWGDLTDKQKVGSIVEKIEENLGDIDILVNCAGGDIGSRGVNNARAGKPTANDPVNISEEDLHSVLDRNLLTCIYCCQVVAPEMKEKRSGSIVNIGSIAGLKGIDGSAIYSTAKAGVHQYSRCLAESLRDHNVRVNVIAPGDTITPRFKASRPLDDSRLENKGTLTGYGTTTEVAEATAFLASEDSSHISGQILRVDGGSQLWPS